MCKVTFKKVTPQLTFLEAWHEFVNNILHCSVMTSKEKQKQNQKLKFTILIENISP